MKLFHRKKRIEEIKKKILLEDNAEFIKSMVSCELIGILDENGEGGTSEKRIEAQTVNMCVNSNNFSQIIHSMSTEEVFEFINRFLNRAVSDIYENGGIIEDFYEAGIKILVLKEYKNALILAILLCELLNELKEENGEEFYCNYSIGMSFENIIVGIVGHDRRRSVLTLSVEAPGLSAWLQSIAGKYYARIIATASFLERIPDVSAHFNIRFLGYIHIKSTGRLEKIYDVFEGDEHKVRNRKRRTKIAFEKGVELFLQGNYGEARQYFIEVLKSDHNDRAAREYVYLCEKTGGDKRAYIESY